MSQNGDPSTEPIGTPPERETSDLDLFADAAEPASSDLSENGRENRPLPSEPPLPREEVEVETIGPERLSLAPGKLRSDYLRHTIQTGVFGLIALLFGVMRLLTDPPSVLWASILVACGVIALAAYKLGTDAFARASYRRYSYRIDASGLEIRRGVLWRSVINIPRSRVQHTDVSRGPVERFFRISSLSIHTAGTTNATVLLPGLESRRALWIRTHLLASDENQDVV